MLAFINQRLPSSSICAVSNNNTSFEDFEILYLQRRIKEGGGLVLWFREEVIRRLSAG